MAIHKYPVLVWRDPTDSFSAALVGDLENAASHAQTKDEALRQLKELLDWRADAPVPGNRRDACSVRYWQTGKRPATMHRPTSSSAIQLSRRGQSQKPR